MANLLVDTRDVEFILYEQLDVEKLCEAERYKEFSKELFQLVLREAEKLAVTEIAPTNSEADREGVRWEAEEVHVPESFQRLWGLFHEGAWMTISDDPEVGGQGMPAVIGLSAHELFIAANVSFMVYSGLTAGAARLIQKYGTEEQKKRFMEKMFKGQWAGTMCLTEPGAGSDVGALKTTARRLPDGTYSITGSKIFISAGDHDLTENIIHPVLARIEGAPQGTKGISLFLVPKIRVNKDGSLGEPNDVKVTAVEHKMGIHGSSTCALSFGEDGRCVGELLGPENKGMRIMFDMMNEARLGVALQALGLASTAYLHALSYAKERIQGSDIREFRDPEAPKVPIIRHPDVRRMLLLMKSMVEGLRALNYYTAYCADRARIAGDEQERRKWSSQVDLFTPVCKAYSSDNGFRVCDMAIQVHGGYGYIREYPVEQFLRDARITSIYEGTNGIQAIDLVARKLGMEKGMVLMSHIQRISCFVDEHREKEVMKPYLERLNLAKNALASVSMFFAQKAKEDLLIPILYASPYLELFGDVTLGWLLLWQAVIAESRLRALFEQKGAREEKDQRGLLEENSEAAFYSGKIESAKFFCNAVLSLSAAKAEAITSAERAALDISERSF